MRLAFSSGILACALFGLVFSSAGFASNQARSETKPKLDKSQMAWGYLTLYTAKTVYQSAEAACPLNPTFFEAIDIEGFKGYVAGAARNFTRVFLPVLAAKSVEALLLESLSFTKAGAKSVAKFVKTFQSGKAGSLLAAAGAGYSSVLLSNGIATLSVSTPALAPLMTFAILVEHLDERSHFNENRTVAPFFYKTISAGLQYAFERGIQDHFFGRTADNFARACSVGSSKVVSSVMTASIISLSELANYCYGDAPGKASEKIERFLKEVGGAAITSVLVAVLLPSTLAIGGKKLIVLVFTVANIVFMVEL